MGPRITLSSFFEGSSKVCFKTLVNYRVFRLYVGKTESWLALMATYKDFRGYKDLCQGGLRLRF